MKNIILILFIFCVSISAQDKLFTLQDVISGGENYRSFYPSKMNNLKWQPKQDAYSWTKGSNLMYKVVEEKEAVLLFDCAVLDSITGQKFTAFPSYSWLDRYTISIEKEDKVFWIDPFQLALIRTVELPTKRVNFKYSNDQLAFSYNKGNDLWVWDIISSQVRKFKCNDGLSKSCKYGFSVYRNEFGIKDGVTWAPSGNRMAFYILSDSMVTDYPLVNYEDRVASHEAIKYPMAGMTSHVARICMWDFKKRKATLLQTAKNENTYHTNIAFSPDDKYACVAELNRGQDTMNFQVYNVKDGSFVKTLFTETSETYVEPEHVPLFVQRKANSFVWQSERTGHNHLYLYDLKRGDCIPLTKGDWDVKHVIGFDNKGENLFFEANPKHPLETQVCKVELRSQKLSILSSSEGKHKGLVSYSGNYVLDTWSSPEVPSKTELITVDGSRKTEVLHIAENPYQDYALGETEIVKLRAADKATNLFGRIIKPANFDPNKKYPVIIYVYGGPHAQLVDKKWMAGARMWQHFMAQRGYIAFTLDSRGSWGRGQAFEDVIHRQLGQNEMLDQMEGVKYLKSLPYVDADNIGVHGWSYGGFMTISLMTNYPDVFKVGVAGGPVIDWKYYEVMYGERYMDTPQENPDGYEKTSLLNKAKDLQGELLIIHGAQDPTVVMQHSMMFVRECIKEGKPVDFFVYPTHKHNVRGKDRVHLMHKVTKYFQDYLPNDN